MFVEEWLAPDTAFVPAPGPRYGDILGQLVRSKDLRGNLVADADAAVAALAIELGVAVVSTDSDFARFPEASWVNPVQ